MYMCIYDIVLHAGEHGNHAALVSQVDVTAVCLQVH